jgi:hypothetical protein
MRFEQPLALLLLALPVLALLRSLVRGAPRARLLATVELMPRAGDPAAVAPRRRVPPSRALLALALVMGTLALAEPRLGPAAILPPWRVVVDRSPSMQLTAEDGTPRHALALRLLQDELGSGPYRFVAGDEPGLEVQGSAPPPEWFEGPPRADPDWMRFDQPGTWWLTDGAPAEGPLRAGLAASGGPAAPGLVSAGPLGALAFDGEQLASRPGEARPGTYRIDPGIPAVLAAAVEAWAEVRGHEPADEEGVPGLWVRAVPRLGEAVGSTGTDPHALEGRGWRLLSGVRAAAAPGVPVAHGAGLAVQPGVLWSGLTAPVTLQGDAAAFAVAVASACDRGLWPGPDVVALDERVAAGASVVRPGAPRPGAVTPLPELEVPLLLAAALLAAGALLAARGGRP